MKTWLIRILRVLQGYWRKRLVRILVAAIVLIGVGYLQYRLAHLPLPIDIERSKDGYTPATAAFVKRETLTIQGLSRSGADEAQNQVLLDDVGNDAVTVEAHLQSAHLHDETTNLLKNAKKPLPAPGQHQVVYTTEGDAESSSTPPSQADTSTAKACRTAIQISLAEKNHMPATLQFYQKEGPGALHRTVEMKASDADLVVELLTRNLAGNFSGPGCRKTIIVGDWSHTFASPAPLKIMLPAGTTLQFGFTAMKDKAPWSGPDGVFEAFKLEGFPITVNSVQKFVNNIEVFNAQAVQVANPLLLKKLLIGSSELQIHYTGQALIKENGNYAVTFSVWEFMKKYPLFAGILAALDTALVAWLFRIVKRTPPPPPDLDVVDY
jgi:hypothetical protein